MKYIRMLFAVVAVTLLLMGCGGTTSSVDFTDAVKQVLAVDANAEPVDINNLIVNNQFAGGEPLPVASFLP